jgi:hypothetical protein
LITLIISCNCLKIAELSRLYHRISPASKSVSQLVKSVEEVNTSFVIVGLFAGLEIRVSATVGCALCALHISNVAVQAIFHTILQSTILQSKGTL